MIEQPFALLRPFTDLRVQLLTKSDHVHTDEECARILGATAIASLRQMHGRNVVRADSATSRMLEADGMITSTPGLMLAIRAADCQNFAVYAPEKHVAGVVHVGWRCLNAKTLTAFYALLTKEWNIEPADTFIAAGPSLGKECAEFTDPSRELPSVPRALIDGRLADLNAAADAELDAIGVPRDHRERIADCTKCHPQKYWTYRGGDRQAVIDGWTNVLAVTLL